MKVDASWMRDIFQFLGEEYTPDHIPTHVSIIFGREDARLAKKAVEMWDDKLGRIMLVTGGIGKDSGEQSRALGSEAAYISQEISKLLLDSKYSTMPTIFLETKATNGGENARFSIDAILANNIPHENVLLIAHTLSLRRLYNTFTFEAERKNLGAEKILRVNSGYAPQVFSGRDVREAVGEMMRLYDSPSKGFMKPDEVLLSRDMKTCLVHAHDLHTQGYTNYLKDGKPVPISFP